MTALLIFVGFVCGVIAGKTIVYTPPRGRTHLIGDILLPRPDDERWSQSAACSEYGACQDTGCARYLKLGVVVVHRRHVLVDGVRHAGPAWRRYAQATFHEQTKRRALAAAGVEP